MTNLLHNYKFLLFMINVLYVFLAAMYAVLIPPWESPDETAHYRYVAELAARWRPALEPTVRQRDRFYRDYDYLSSNYEWFEPAMGYLPAALIYKIIESVSPGSLPKDIPLVNPLFAVDPFRYSRLFATSSFDSPSVWLDEWGLLAIRIALSLFGLVVINAAYFIGNLLDKADGLLGVAVSGCLAFLPQFIFSNATVRGETLANALAAMVFLIAVLMQIRTDKLDQYAVLMGVLVGLGLLAKYTFFAVVPIGPLAIILASPHGPRSWVKLLSYMLIPTIILCGAYYLAFTEARYALTYAFATRSIIPDSHLTWDYVKEIPGPLLIDLFYARFGWANVATPAILSRIVFCFWAVGTFSSLVYAVYSRHAPAVRQSTRIMAILGLGLFLTLIGIFRYNLWQFTPQGRYVFPAIVPWAVLGFWGPLQSLPQFGRTALAIVAIVFMLVFNLYSLFFVLLPAYY
jgi:hypothetical protein